MRVEPAVPHEIGGEPTLSISAAQLEAVIRRIVREELARQDRQPRG